MAKVLFNLSNGLTAVLSCNGNSCKLQVPGTGTNMIDKIDAIEGIDVVQVTFHRSSSFSIVEIVTVLFPENLVDSVTEVLIDAFGGLREIVWSSIFPGS